MTQGQGFAWLRGIASNDYIKGKKRLIPQDEASYYIVERLMLRALADLGIGIVYERPAGEPLPVLMTHRHNNAYIFSLFTPSTTVKTKLKFPLGAPILDAYETRLENGFSTYHFPKSERKECRVFVEQKEGIVFCHEHYPGSAVFRRRIKVGGLKNATVRFLAEDYCKNEVDVCLNTTDVCCVLTDPVEPHYITRNGITWCEVQNVTGSLIFSMPMKEELFFKADSLK
jgi:hypothetical protein